jgi:hypothetical protein
MNEQVAQAKAKVERLYEEFKEAQKEYLEIVVAMSNFKAGDIIRYDGVEWRIARIDPSMGYAAYYGNPKKKNGDWSLKEKYLTIDATKFEPVDN